MVQLPIQTVFTSLIQAGKGADVILVFAGPSTLIKDMLINSLMKFVHGS
jgi:hypothetical protein